MSFSPYFVRLTDIIGEFPDDRMETRMRKSPPLRKIITTAPRTTGQISRTIGEVLHTNMLMCGTCEKSIMQLAVTHVTKIRRRSDRSLAEAGIAWTKVEARIQIY